MTIVILYLYEMGKKVRKQNVSSLCDVVHIFIYLFNVYKISSIIY